MLFSRALRIASLAVVFLLAGAAHALYTSGDDVVQLTAANFDSLVANSPDPWIVEFFAPWCGHCVSLAPEYKKAASVLKGIVKVGAVDATQAEALASRFQVKGFPTIKVFGANKKSPADYNGERNAKGLADAALREARSIVSGRLTGKTSGSSASSSSSSSKSKDSGSSNGSNNGAGSSNAGSGSVIELTESDFNSKVMNSKDFWLVSFTAPWCGHCQRLKPEYSQAARQLKGRTAHLANVDCTQHQSLCQKYDVRGYPTVKVFGYGDKRKPSDYNGGRTASDIVTYVSNEADKHTPAPTPVELVDQSTFDGCAEKTLCVVAFLPNVLDSGIEGRNGYIAELTKAAAKLKRSSVGWVWAQGNRQSALEQALEVGGAGYPALAAVNVAKGKFAPMLGSFSADGISSFVDRLVSGRESVISVSKLPAIAKTQKWDGKMPRDEL